MTEQFANFALTTLNGTILSGALSLQVTSATAFPTTGNFRILVENEIMLVTTVTGTTFTVTRAQEGTLAANHNSGVLVTQIITSGAINQAKSDVSLLRTVFDLDLTAQTTQTFTTDGNYTVGGYTAVKTNSSGDASPMVLTHNTGVVVQPTASTDLLSSTMSLPVLSWTLSQFAPRLTYGCKIMVWAHVSAQNLSTNFDQATLFVGNGPFTGTTGIVYGAKQESTGTPPNLRWRSSVNAAGSNITNTTTQPARSNTDNTLVLVVPRWPFYDHVIMSGTYSGGWPAASALNPLFTYNDSRTGLLDVSTAALPTQIAFGIGAGRSGSGTSLSVTFAHVRVDIDFTGS